MNQRLTHQQGVMVGHKRKDARSKTSRSSKCVDRERRSYKRSDKAQLKEDIRAGKYARFIGT